MKLKLCGLFGTTLLLVTWHVIVTTLDIPSYVLPSPIHIGEFIFRNAGPLATNATWTLAEAAAGTMLAIPGGIMLAVLLARYKFLDASIRPLVIFAQSTPLLAVAPLISAWLGSGFLSKAILASIISFPPLTVGIYNALRIDRQDEVDLFRSMGASDWQMLYYLRFPRALPALFSALQLVIPLAILGAIVGEFVGANRGLGFQIMSASYYLRIPEMFAAVVIASVSAIFLVFLVRRVAERLMWKE
jgi:ABC-type nitrate/sulfonate/bicarbonate transport system permease component